MRIVTEERAMVSPEPKTLIFLFLAFPAFLSAQLNEFEIRRLETPEGIPVFRRHPDEAVLIIYSPMPNLQFESNMAGIVEQKNTPDEQKYELFITPEKQTITVKAAGYKDGDIRIKLINAKESHFYGIEPKRKPINPDRGDFVLNSVPPGARFEIDGSGIGGTTPYSSRTEVPNGLLAETFVVRVSKENYETKVDTLFIEKAKTTTKTIVLTPKFGYVTVDTRHTDAKLYINGVQRNFQPRNPIEVNVGKLSIELKKDYYHNFMTPVRVDPNDNSTESILIHIELIRQKGRLVVNTNPPNAKVYLDAQYLGNTPLNQTVNAGRYILEVRKDNHRNEKENIEVLNSQTTSENIILYQNGIIHIEGTQGANVYINDEYEGTIPITSKIMEHGQYRIRVQKGGYDTEETTFTVKAEERTLTYDLAKTKWRALRWTAFGNQRISSILNSFSASAGYFKLPVTSKLVFSATKNFAAEATTVEGLAADASIFVTPLTFTFGFGLFGDQRDLSPAEKDTLKPVLVYANVDWAPFVFYEVLYPSIGINYTYGKFDYVIGREKSNKLKYASWGLHYELRISTHNKKGGLFLKLGYTDYFDKSGFENLLYINGGVWRSFRKEQ